MFFFVRFFYSHICFLIFLSLILPFGIGNSQSVTLAYGPYAGRVKTILISPDGNRFAGADDFGIFRASPGSDYWTSVNTGLEHKSVWCLAQNSSLHIFAGTLYGGIYKSSDLGQSWYAVNGGLTSLDVRSLAVTNHNTLIAGTADGGAFRSTDGGENWIASSAGMNAHMILSLAMDSSGNIFAGTAGQGVFRSTDDGLNWQAVNQGLSNLFIWSMAAGGQHVLAGSMGGGVHWSTDSGNSWIPVGLTESYINALDINGEGTFYAGTRGKGIYCSSNFGQSWNYVSVTLPDSVFWSLASDQVGNIYAGSDLRGIFRTSMNNLDWTQYGLPVVRLKSLGTRFQDTVFAGSFQEGLFRSTNSGTHWHWIPMPYSNMDINAALKLSDHSVLTGTRLFGILRSDATLSNWTSSNQGLPPVPVTALAQSDSVLFAGTSGKGIFRSADSGFSWQMTGLLFQFISNIFVSQGTGIFAAAPGHGVYRSTDLGLSWFAVNSGLTNLFVYDVLVNHAGIVFAATDGGGVFRSDNHGLSWISANNGLPHLNIRALAEDQQRIFSGGRFLYFSDDYGDSWQMFPGPDSMRNIKAISNGHPVIVATETNGIFTIPPVATDCDKNSIERPSQFAIRNFPNPFNGTTSIRYHVPQREMIRLSVFNILGEEVKILYEGIAGPGWHTSEWNGKNSKGRDTASGIYLLRFSGQSFTLSKKILFLK